jgi:hypothetical protein
MPPRALRAIDPRHRNGARWFAAGGGFAAVSLHEVPAGCVRVKAGHDPHTALDAEG